MDNSEDFHSYPDGNDDAFSSTFKKIIEKQNHLEYKKMLLQNEKKTLKNNLFKLREEKKERIMQKEILKLTVIEEQDNYDSFNSKLDEEIVSIKSLLSDVETANEQSNASIEKNSIVEMFFNGISEAYKDVQEKANNFALKITQENIDLGDKVANMKELNETIFTDLQNESVLCKNDSEQIDDALSLMKKILFEKHLELSKIIVAAEYVTDEIAKYAMILRDYETKLNVLLSDGKKYIDGEQTLICELEGSHEKLRSKLCEFEDVEQETKQFVFDIRQNLTELEDLLNSNASEEQVSHEVYQVKDKTVEELIEIESSLKSDLKIKEDISQENERLAFFVEEMTNKYKDTNSERTEIHLLIANLDHDLSTLLQCVKTKNDNKIEIIEENKKLQSVSEEMESQLNNMIKKHNEYVNSLNEESASSGKCLEKLKDTVIEIETSSRDKSCYVRNLNPKIQENKTCFATVNELSEIESKKVNDLEMKIEEYYEKFLITLKEMSAQHDLKKKELNNLENMAEKVRFLEDEISHLELQLENQNKQNQSELLNFEEVHLMKMKDAEERKKLLKVELENKHKQLHTEVLQNQTSLTGLQNIESKSKESKEEIRIDLKNIKEKVIKLHKTKDLVQSKFESAIQNLSKTTDNRMEDVTSSQISMQSQHKTPRKPIQKMKPPQLVEDDDSSSGISTTDAKWSLPSKRKLSLESSFSKEKPNSKKKILRKSHPN